MIRVERSECIGILFGNQDIATMKAFANIYIDEKITGVCEAGITTKHPANFYCTRPLGHGGLHIAVGLDVVAVFDEEGTDFYQTVGDQF